MATYKVPQDVEADDKLIGPFSFRQFIYLIVVALAGALAWGLAQLFLPLAIIPLPIILLFGALALPLRKDQPMEIYLAAIISYFLKPHQRLWDPDGIESLIEITVPKTIEVQRTKDISQSEAQRRFSYLAEIVDTQGWSVRGAGLQAPNSAMKSDAYFDAQQAVDILDEGNTISQTLNDKLSQSTARIQQDAKNLMKGQPAQNLSNYFNNPVTNQPTTPEPVADQNLQYNPYPNIQQSVIQPISTQPIAANPPTTTSVKVVPAGIIDLANNSNLSIETIAREANRIKGKQDLNEEVVVSLR